MIDMQREYLRMLGEWSDIQDHMPMLRDYAAATPGCRVLELGVRNGYSTSALLAGVQQSGGHLWSVDGMLPGVPQEWYGLPFWSFRHQPDLSYDGPCKEGSLASWPYLRCVDVLFVDTSHEYKHTLAELRRFVPHVRTGGVVLLHDTKLTNEAGRTSRERHGVVEALNDYCRDLEAATGQPEIRWVNHLGQPGMFGLGQIDVTW